MDLYFSVIKYRIYPIIPKIIGASLSEPHTSDSFVGSSFYEYMR